MKILVILAFLLACPIIAFGQATLAGTVKDPLGASLPGVLVEARSPALIEKIRTAMTDSTGKYRIQDLPPGAYRVRFSLAGWTPFEKTDVVLAGSFTATVNASLIVGPLNEAITVSGEPPVIDVRSARRELTLSGETVKSAPTVRSYNALVVLVPGVVTNGNDTVTGTSTTAFPMHGGRTNEGRLTVDALNIGSPAAGNGPTSYVIDVGNSDEVTFATTGAQGETETSGLVMNIVPKSGGNTTHASFFASGTAAKLQSSNLTRMLKAQGVTAASPLTRVYDLAGTIGGPLAKNRLWYFVNAHAGGSTKTSSTIFYNVNAGNPAAWLYSADPNRREYSDRTFENISGRVTWQATPRNKISVFWDEQALCRACTGATPGLSEPVQISPEAVGVLGRPLRVTQAKWWSPVTDRLFFDAGFGGTYFGVGNFERDPNPTRDLIRVVEQCASGCAANGNIPGLVYRSQDFSTAHSGSYLWSGSMSYVTGSHSLKIGYQHTLMIDDRTWMTNNQNLTYRLNNGVPNQLTESISPWVNNARAGWDALFVQDQWTRRRLTLQGALRFDRATSWFPMQQEGPSRFLPTPIVIPQTRGVDSYKDITPRVGAAFDASGNGRTAIKLIVGKYLDGVGVSGVYANTNPTLRMPQTTSIFGTAGVSRAWTDTNQNFVPDCDLLNPNAQDLRAAGGDFCGVVSNTSFGQNVLTNQFDSALLNGWRVRPSDWDLGLSVQQQIKARSAVDVTYTRRWFHGFTAVDNLALEPSDLTPFSIVAPNDSRLPGGGGYLITDLYDVVPEKAGQVNNLIGDSRKYGTWSQYFNGIDITANIRSIQGFTFVGGLSAGQTVADNCDVRARLPELSTTTTGTSAFGAGYAGSDVTPVSPYCHVAFGILTQIRGLSSYLVPKANIQLAAVVQSKPGPMLAANYAVPNSTVAPSLGRNLSGEAPNVTVNLIEPGTMYGDRITQVDLRVAKMLTFRRSRALIGVDIYNALNSSATLMFNNTFVPGGTWLQPLSILTPRFFRITTELLF